MPPSAAAAAAAALKQEAEDIKIPTDHGRDVLAL